jgi:hypothetical protein
MAEFARKWGMPVGRIFPFTLNTGVLRVSAHHADLLESWKIMLQDQCYQAAQLQSFYHRPAHMVGDQDVLTALLSCSSFSMTPVLILRRGQDILQYFGFSAYTTRERLGNLFGDRPSFIHCQGWKPWKALAQGSSRSGFKDGLQRLYTELSPYISSAERYRLELDEPLPWASNMSRISRFFRAIGLRNPALTGLPIAMLVDIWRAGRRWAHSIRPG